MIIEFKNQKNTKKTEIEELKTKTKINAFSSYQSASIISFFEFDFKLLKIKKHIYSLHDKLSLELKTLQDEQISYARNFRLLVDNTLENILKLITAKEPKINLNLFGSVAMNLCMPWSDADVSIQNNNKKEKTDKDLFESVYVILEVILLDKQTTFQKSFLHIPSIHARNFYYH